MKLSSVQTRLDQALVAVQSKATQASKAVKSTVTRVAGSINFKQTAESTKLSASALVGRIQKNWNNMSTAKKVATVAATTILVAGAIAAAIFGSHVAAILGIGAALAHSAVAYGAPIGLGVVGLTAPAVALLKKPTEKKVVVKAQVESRTTIAKNFVRDNRRVILGTAAAALIIGGAVLGYRNRESIKAAGKAAFEGIKTPRQTMKNLGLGAKNKVVNFGLSAKDAVLSVPGKVKSTATLAVGVVQASGELVVDTARSGVSRATSAVAGKIPAKATLVASTIVSGVKNGAKSGYDFAKAQVFKLPGLRA